MGGIAPGLRKTGLVPLAHRGQGEQPISIGACREAELQIVGADAEGHRREKGIHRSEARAAQPRPAMAHQTVDPQLL